MGYSMGSLATFTIASDPRLTTTVHISGGNFVPERVKNLRQPAAFLCGRTGDATCNLLSPDCDIAAAQCDRDFANATTPVFYGRFPAGHLGILQEPHANRIAAAVTGWLRWKLTTLALLACSLERSAPCAATPTGACSRRVYRQRSPRLEHTAGP